MNKEKHKKIESIYKNCIIRVEGKHAFHRGDRFANFEEVTDRLQAHTQESLVYYWIRDSRLVKFAHTKVSRKIDEKLQYYSIRFSCIFGGQRFKSRANGLRPCKRQTRQIDCPAFISLRATKCGQKLEVIDVCNDHTHEISEQAVQELPQKRRPSQGLLEEIHELLHLNVDKKMIIEYVQLKENKNILKKDLFNMATHLPRKRSDNEQKAILHRINSSATEDAIQNAVSRRLLQFNSDNSLDSASYQDVLRSNQNTIDAFDTSTPSAIDFTTLSPEIDLLNATDGVKEQLEYEELLSNRISVDYEVEALVVKQPKTEYNTCISHDKWSEAANRKTVIYKDFICGDDSNYEYDGLGLREKISTDSVVEDSAPHSPLSNHSPDLDDKAYFNDLILISPGETICPVELSLSRSEDLVEEKCPVEDQRIENLNDVPLKIIKPVKRMKRKELGKYLTQKSRRIIMNCRSCGANARLIEMQLSCLRQRRLKLFQETVVLKLQKQKLKAEIAAIRKNTEL